MSNQLDNIETEVTKLTESVNKLNSLLGGDEFGREGIVAKQARNHKRITGLENSRRKFTWIGTIVGAIAAGLSMFKDDVVTYFSK